jgi:hypothetical protein
MLTRNNLNLLLVSALQFFCFSVNAQQTDTISFFSKLNFYKDTLYIKARFMECGEWGGHLELTKIYLKDDDFHFSYQKYKADCSKITENNGEPSQLLELSIERPLSNKNKQLIKQYACLLVAAKFRETDPMNAGYMFEMKNVDETLNMHVYTWGRTTKDEYLDFITHLLN